MYMYIYIITLLLLVITVYTMLQAILGTEYPDWKNTLYIRRRHEDVD